MLLKHFFFYFLFNISLNVCALKSRRGLTPAQGQALLDSVVKLTDSLIEVTPYLNSTVNEIAPNCVQMLCKFVCFNGVLEEIEVDVLMVSETNNNFCMRIEELRLYNYAFPSGKLSYGFLGNYSDKIEVLYLGSANITEIEAGAFAKGKFQEIYFENLQLMELRKDFFQNISHDFQALSIIQKQNPIQTIHSDFLCDVKYLIKSLTIQAGLKSISNLTGGDYLLSNLARTDFSHNNFGSNMESAALSKVSMLEWLDLSYSNLEYIPSYLFADSITTLEYLDLSHNKLKTISRYIFGWREIPRDLKIYAENNEWTCSCYLQQEFRFIFIHYRTPLVCSQPDDYKGLWVFDDQICGGNIEPYEPSTEITTNIPTAEISSISTQESNFEQSTSLPLNKTLNDKTTPGYKLPRKFLKLECLIKRFKHFESTSHLMHWPLIVFNLIAHDMHVDVVIDSFEQPYESFGLVWFSKITSQYYKMEINYNEYGLGCYRNISLVTTVTDLLPNTAYTFCLVFKQQLQISPFNCKSVYMESHAAIKKRAWLTRSMRVTGLILTIFGIIMFLLAGVFMVYLVFKHKPTLLRGSQRAKTDNSKGNDIVISPKQKSVYSIKEKEDKLGRFGPFSISQIRRNSNDSEASYESYINTNVYEVIPAFEKRNTKKANEFFKNTEQETTLAEIYNQDTDSCYLTPLESIPNPRKFVHYAELPNRSKRNSHDVLPQLPIETAPHCLENKPDYAKIGNIYFMDSHV